MSILVKPKSIALERKLFQRKLQMSVKTTILPSCSGTNCGANPFLAWMLAIEVLSITIVGTQIVLQQIRKNYSESVKLTRLLCMAGTMISQGSQKQM